jgi:O-antigen/teichoic acid export membrane protein
VRDPANRYPDLRGNLVATVLFVATVLALWGLGRFDAVAAITALISVGLAWAAYLIIAKRRNPTRLK